MKLRVSLKSCPASRRWHFEISTRAGCLCEVQDRISLACRHTSLGEAYKFQVSAIIPVIPFHC